MKKSLETLAFYLCLAGELVMVLFGCSAVAMILIVIFENDSDFIDKVGFWKTAVILLIYFGISLVFLDMMRLRIKIRNHKKNRND